MLAALLASSLWLAASEAGARPDALTSAASAEVPKVQVEAIADQFGRDMYWLVGSHAADLYSTAWALHRCETCAEGNPFGPTAEARIALKMAGVASTGLTLWKLRRSGKGKAATVLRWTYVALNAGLTINNTRRAIRKR